MKKIKTCQFGFKKWLWFKTIAQFMIVGKRRIDIVHLQNNEYDLTDV
jgi:hypothetical protein